MEVATPIARPPDFHFNHSTFSPYATAPSSPSLLVVNLNHQYLYTSAPASPAGASPLWAYPSPISPHRNDNSGDVFEFPFSPIRYHHPQTVRRNPLAKNSSGQRRRRSRSLSPVRDEEHIAKPASPSANPVKCGLSRKWPKLRDLLLFRSGSEGRVTGRGSKDPLKKYTILPSVSADRAGEDKKGGNRGGGGGEMGRRVSRPPVSAHEKHYTANRAAAEEQKRKTPLPFQRHGLLGLADFRPAIRGKNKVVGTSSVSTGRF